MSTKYEAMKAGGATPAMIAETAKADGLDTPARIRVLRSLFGLSLPDAKEILLATPLTEHEARIAEALEREI